MKYSLARNLFTIFFISILLLGCSSNFFRESSTEIKIYFPSQIWNRFAPMDANFEITNLKKTYEVKITLGVMDGFNLETLPVEIVITSPSGQQNIIGKTFAIKKDGKYIGNVRGDIWTTSLVIYPFKQFLEEGMYSVQILNRTQYYDLPNVESLSFEIHPVKMPKEKKE